MFANEILVCFMLPMPIELHRVYHLFTTVIHNGMCIEDACMEDAYWMSMVYAEMCVVYAEMCVVYAGCV